MERLYENVIKQHIKSHRQMLFLAGPRQVGKTTISLSAKSLTSNFNYLNWDNHDHRQLILQGPTAVANKLLLKTAQELIPIAVFDELHKYRLWKTFLKGFFDTYQTQTRIIVTGSSRLDIYRRGNDSLMGRYFPYRVHPLSVAECLRTEVSTCEIQAPQKIEDEKFDALFEFGGFPEPFLNRNNAFSRRWKRLRREQLFRGDIRDLNRIHDIDRLEILAELLKQQAGQLTNYTNLANKLKVSVDTVRRWILLLNEFYFCFVIKPWTKNVSRSLLKEPKIYLWDWSDIDDIGQRSENFIASHLLKATHFWTDQGYGDFELFFLRDKEKREVDFIVTKNNQPWFLVETKYGDSSQNTKHLEVFQKQTQAKHAFKVVMNLEYMDIDCFSYHQPMIVSAKTLLSQLV